MNQVINSNPLSLFMLIDVTYPNSSYQSMMHEFRVFHHCIWNHVPTFQNRVYDMNVLRSTPSSVRTLLHPTKHQNKHF